MATLPQAAMRGARHHRVFTKQKGVTVKVTPFCLANDGNFDTKTIPRRDSVPCQPHNVL